MHMVLVRPFCAESHAVFRVMYICAAAYCKAFALLARTVGINGEQCLDHFAVLVRTMRLADDYFFSCQAGITVGSVLNDGSISACPSIRADFHQGNIYKDEFMDVWENNYQPYRDRTWMKKGECATCKYFRYCRGNGMHLRDGQGELMVCHLKRIVNP